MPQSTMVDFSPPVITAAAAAAANALEYYEVENNFDPVVTGLAHTSANAVARTADKSKAWEAFGLGNNDWVPTTDRAGLALTTKGAMAVRGATELVELLPGANGTLLASDSTKPEGLGYVTPNLSRADTVPGAGVSVTIVGNRAIASRGRYIATVGSQVSIVDVLNPAVPVLLSNNNVLTAGTARKACWSGDVIWVARHDGNLQLLDAKKPNTITAFSGGTSGVVYAGGDLQGMDVFGDYAAIVSVNGAGNNFFIVDGSNKASPTVIGTLALGDLAPRSVRVVGKYAFVTLNTSSVLQIIDISVLTAPAVITGGAGGIVSTPGSAKSVEVANNLAYVATYASAGPTLQRLYVVDVSNVATPTVLGYVSIGVGAQAIGLGGTRVFIALGNVSQVQIVDASNPSTPVAGDSVVTGNTPVDITVGNGYFATVDQLGNTCTVHSITNRVEADLSRLGRATAQSLFVETRVSVAGDVQAAGCMRARAFTLDNPPVFATGAGHTVDELIAVLQQQGKLRQS
jgi:hypothetical protein